MRESEQNTHNTQPERKLMSSQGTNYYHFIEHFVEEGSWLIHILLVIVFGFLPPPHWNFRSRSKAKLYSDGKIRYNLRLHHASEAQYRISFVNFKRSEC